MERRKLDKTVQAGKPKNCYMSIEQIKELSIKRDVSQSLIIAFAVDAYYKEEENGK